MATLSILYATATQQAFTASAILSDTGFSTGRAGTPFSNATYLYVDVLFSGVIKTATSLTLNSQIQVWVAANKNGATNLTANCPTAEGAFTPGGETALMQLAHSVNVTSTATTSERQWDFGPISIASLYGGTLPQHFNFYVVHNTQATGAGLATSTATSHWFTFQGVNYTSA